MTEAQVLGATDQAEAGLYLGQNVGRLVSKANNGTMMNLLFFLLFG